MEQSANTSVAREFEPEDPMVTASTDKTSSLSDKIAEKLGEKAEAAMDHIGSAMETADDSLQRVRFAAGTLQTALKKSLKEQPNATLAAATIVGFVLGALWKATR
jgi:ElaB/YqjD/DUF883 family membrane-anchored ribosome-binding protein